MSPRGSKQCPKCQAFVGPRLETCECSYTFPFKHLPKPKKIKPKPPEHPTPELSENPSEVIAVDDPNTLRAFIDQLKNCCDDASRTGGVYSAFLHHKTGTLQVEVGFLTRLK